MGFLFTGGKQEKLWRTCFLISCLSLFQRNTIPTLQYCQGYSPGQVCSMVWEALHLRTTCESLGSLWTYEKQDFRRKQMSQMVVPVGTCVFSVKSNIFFFTTWNKCTWLPVMIVIASCCTCLPCFYPIALIPFYESPSRDVSQIRTCCKHYLTLKLASCVIRPASPLSVAFKWIADTKLFVVFTINVLIKVVSLIRS